MKAIKIEEFIKELDAANKVFLGEISLSGADLIIEKTYTDEDGKEATRELKRGLGDCGEASRILRLMSKCSTLTSLVLCNQNLKLGNLSDIAAVVANNPRLTVLNLDKNPLFLLQF